MSFMQKRALKIYWAGDLFDAKDLCGNLLLADAVEKISGNRYKVMLPQNGECEVVERSSQSIRDADFELLYKCDCIVANFDGCDPDSGTVVEFCFAKMVDMPAVLLRSDFRNSGDATLPDSEPWNLMCSHYPRTRVLHINSMQLYHRLRQNGAANGELVKEFAFSIARQVVAALDESAAQKSWLAREDAVSQYIRAVKSIGGALEKSLDEETLDLLVKEKAAAGLFD